MHHPTTTSSRLGAGLALFCTLATGLVAQTTVAIVAKADNTLYNDGVGAASNGAGPGFFVGINGTGWSTRGVMQFDVAAVIPSGAAIVSAQLTIESQQSNYFPNLVVTGHRVLQAWGQGTSVGLAGGGFGAPATPGDATWLHTFFPGSLWTTPGGDFVAAPSLSITTPRLGVASSGHGPESVADVQSWLDNPAQNFGWLLKSNEALPGPTARRFASREATTGTKPTLTVTYVVDGQVGTWGTGCPTANGTFSFAYGGPMTGGTTIALNHFNGPPTTVGINYFALNLYQPGGLIQPSCNLYLPVTESWIPGEIFLLDASGNGSATWPVPSIYPGLYFVTQSAALDNSPFGLSLTNAGVGKIL